MSVPATETNLHFDIHASIVFQLGDDLITDVVQAVIELVKNSYDADANYANVVVDSHKPNDVPNTFFPDAKGFIVIEDDGVGMDLATIQRGWLTISNSIKREMKHNRMTTVEKHRTPLGDKGLGRLGVQKLGFNVEIFTKPKDGKDEYHVGWCWKEFQGESTLAEIYPRVEKMQPTRERGTKLVISDIADPDHWQSADSLSEFEQKLSELISPYRDFSEFTIAASVDGHSIELADITERIRRLAHLRYKIDFDGRKFSVNGKASMDFIRPKSGEQDLATFHQLVEADDGERFIAFLENDPVASSIKLQKSRSKSWFVEFSQTTDVCSMPELRLISANDALDPDKKVFANPGPFHSEVDAFDLSSRATAFQSVFDKAADYKNYIKHLNGVRIFRDGFGVRVDRDWLGLSKQWTTASSYYSLKPENTMGFVALTAEANASLVETTDREGFKRSPHFDNFMALFAEFVKFSHTAQEFLRRGWLAFLKENQRTEAHVGPEETPEQLYRKLEDGLADSGTFKEPLEKAIEVLGNATTVMATAVERATAANPKSSDSKELAKLVGKLSARVGDAKQVLGRVTEFLAEVQKLRGIALVLHDESLVIRSQLEESYEVVSLGLTAEALSHEINEIADKIARKTQDLSRYLEKAKITDAKVLGYVEFIRASVAALRKQMAHLAPSLKYVREQRATVNMGEFLEDIKTYFHDRWSAEQIKIEIREKKDPLVININRGKLTQVFDNLILNSEYWLREEIRVGRICAGSVTIEIASPFVHVWDNGPGIDPLIEATLFEPFVSKKPKSKGRGLGLFIVRQLLDTEDCQITLSPRRNERGRLYRFDIDFSGALDGQ